MTGHLANALTIAGHCTFSAQLEHHLRCALGMAPGNDVLCMGQASQRGHILDAG